MECKNTSPQLCSNDVLLRKTQITYKRRHLRETLDEELSPVTYNRSQETITPVRSRWTESSVTLQNFGVHPLSDFSPRERVMYRKMKPMEHSRRIVDARRKRINVKKASRQ